MQSIEAFLHGLTQSRLLSAERFAAVQQWLKEPDGPTTPAQVIDRLVARDWITPWQGQMLLAGKRAFFLGKYKLLTLLGQGGMGSVFKAEQEPLGRIVALKVMAERLVKDKQAVIRFHREIQAAAALTHRNIVAAYDADQVGRTHFLVMEYVRGLTLEEVVQQRGPLPIGEACEYVRQAAVGLQHAFEQGMTHRDVKPSNLLLTQGPDGPLVKIMDMGLARIQTDSPEDHALTQTGQVLGTPDYISPEQAQNTRAADIRSDLFSLGCTLFRLLTGGVPYGGATVMAKLMARAMEPAQRVRAVRPDVPAALDALVAKLLARNPDERYQTPAEAAAALLPFSGVSGTSPEATLLVSTTPDNASGQTIQLDAWPERALHRSGTQPLAQPAGIDSSLDQFLQQLTPSAEAAATVDQVETAALKDGTTDFPSEESISGEWRRPQKGQRGLLAGVGLGTAVVVIVGGIALWSLTGATTLDIEWPEQERAGGTLEVDGRRVEVPKTGPLRFRGIPGRRTVKATREGYHSIQQEWTAGRGETKSLDFHWQPTADTQRQLELTLLKTEIAALNKKVAVGTLRETDGAIAALWDRGNRFLRLHPGTTARDQLAAALSTLPAPADQPQHNRLPRGLARQVPPEVVAVYGDNRFRSLGEHQVAAMSPDGQWLATGSRERLVRLWHVKDPKRSLTLIGGGGHTSDLWFTADSKQLVGVGFQNLCIWDVATGEAVRKLHVPTDRGNTAACFSADGQQIALADDSGHVSIWSESKKGWTDLPDYHRGCHRLAFTPDGKVLVVAGFPPKDSDQNNGLQLTWWNLADGQRLKLVEDLSHGLDLSQDGRRGVTAGRDGIKVYDLVTREVYRTLETGRPSERLAISPDGRHVASLETDTRIVDVESGKVIHTHRMRPAFAKFTPDGNALVTCAMEHRTRVAPIDNLSGDLVPSNPSIRCVALEGTGHSVALGTSDGQILSVDLATGAERQQYKLLEGAIFRLAADPRGTHYFASCGTDRQGERYFRVDAVTRQVAFPAYPARHVQDVEFTPDGRQVAIGTFEGLLQVIDTIQGVELFQLQVNSPEHREEIYSLAWNALGMRIAVGSVRGPNALRIWDVKTRAPIAAFTGHEGHVYGVAFSTDGQTLYSACTDGKVRAWDVATQEEKATLVFRNRQPINSLSLSPDGSKLLATSSDGELIVTQLPDGEPTRIFRMPNAGDLLDAIWTPDSRHAVTINEDGTSYLVRLDDRPQP